MNLGERDAFHRGFSLAVRLMVEAMTSDDKRENLTRPVSPRVAQKEKWGTYPTLPNKAHTDDLSRFVGGVSGDKKGAAELLCCTFDYNICISFSWRV